MISARMVNPFRDFRENPLFNQFKGWKLFSKKGPEAVPTQHKNGCVGSLLKETLSTRDFFELLARHTGRSVPSRWLPMLRCLSFLFLSFPSSVSFYPSCNSSFGLPKSPPVLHLVRE